MFTGGLIPGPGLLFSEPQVSVNYFRYFPLFSKCKCPFYEEYNTARWYDPHMELFSVAEYAAFNHNDNKWNPKESDSLIPYLFTIYFSTQILVFVYDMLEYPGILAGEF